MNATTRTRTIAVTGIVAIASLLGGGAAVVAAAPAPYEGSQSAVHHEAAPSAPYEGAKTTAVSNPFEVIHTAAVTRQWEEAPSINTTAVSRQWEEASSIHTTAATRPYEGAAPRPFEI